nr:MAG TPA: hypothetical protein [Bacteriophage sp.]
MLGCKRLFLLIGFKFKCLFLQTVNPCKQKIVQMQLPFVPFVCGSRVCRAHFAGGAAISSIALPLTAKAKIHQTLLNAK